MLPPRQAAPRVSNAMAVVIWPSGAPSASLKAGEMDGRLDFATAMGCGDPFCRDMDNCAGAGSMGSRNLQGGTGAFKTAVMAPEKLPLPPERWKTEQQRGDRQQNSEGRLKQDLAVKPWWGVRHGIGAI